MCIRDRVKQKGAERKPEAPKKKGLFTKCCMIIKDDFRRKFMNIKTITNETPVGWDEYRQFCELAKGGKQNGGV